MAKQKFNRSCKHYVGDGRGNRDVYLNGERVSHVISADTKRGIVRVHRLDEMRNFMYHSNGAPKIQKLRGKVVVKFWKDYPT
ncbi:hypothetical protein [Wielerella bovis]|uniref:hypothetical protein n=1 Tax=Wielerella bovis TaxID=2917790 RepID=UPI002018E282|nr:hypothetical protein [Wielerella bovis]ULJ67902.1 hypothetical protein MIS31_05005 [Wielerella bovis]